MSNLFVYSAFLFLLNITSYVPPLFVFNNPEIFYNKTRFPNKNDLKKLKNPVLL